MKTTTWLLAPLALATASCLIELSPSAADPSTTPAPFVRPDASASSHANDASAVDAIAPSVVDATLAPMEAATDSGAPVVNASSDASLAPGATSL